MVRQPQPNWKCNVKARLHRRFLSRLSCNFKIARVNQVRFSVRFVAAISQAFRTCLKLDAILLRQKLHRVAAIKIACVNGPLEGKLTLVSACWSSVDRCPQINSLSCLFLSRFPFTFLWFDDSEHLRYYISVFPLQQINFTAKQYPAANFNGSCYCYWDCLLEWQGCVPALVGHVTAMITSLMCCHPRCHKVEKLYKQKTWVFSPGFPYLRRSNWVCKLISGFFLRKLATSPSIIHAPKRSKRFWIFLRIPLLRLLLWRSSAITLFAKVNINFLRDQWVYRKKKPSSFCCPSPNDWQCVLFGRTRVCS